MKKLKEILDSYKNKKVLITGGSGYIGSCIAKELSNHCAEIIISSRTEKQDNLYTYKVTNLVEESFWDEMVDHVDVIFHLGGNTSLYHAQDFPFENLKNSILPLQYLGKSLQEAKKNIKLINASTATIYGLDPKLPVSESHPLEPHTIYDVHKVFVENYLSYLKKSTGLRYSSLRLSNVYGPSESPSSSSDRGILNKMALSLLKGEDINIYGSGDYIRDYIYINDAVEAFIRAGAIDCDKEAVFNICSGTSISLKDVVQLLSNILGGSRKSKINHVKWPVEANEIERRNFQGDNKLFSDKFFWNPKTDLEAGLKLLSERISL